MLNLYEAKEQLISDTPLLLFDCTFGDGIVEHWCTHGVTVSGIQYAARVLKQNAFQSQYGSDLGVDTVPQITIELANADSHFSEIEQSAGVKGGQLTVSMVFYNFPSNTASSNVQVLFKGILNPPDMITEEVFRVSASNRLSLQRVVLPDIRIQKRCPWSFPTSLTQRQEAVSGGPYQQYSRFYRCGYSPDVTGGVGNLAADGTAYASCAYTRADCSTRGMFSVDSLLRNTARFGGIEFVPATIMVRSAGEKGTHLSPLDDNEARYNDFVPLIYGTARYSPGIVFARNDGNLTHFELILGAGQIQDIQQVLVNDIEIPNGQPGQNMTGTGWYNLVSAGQRNGAFNSDFTDSNGNPLGDPYGSMAFLSVVVPNRINDGTSLPNIEVLVDGLQVPQYASDGSIIGESFSNNPAWVILDLLMRIGWLLGEMDLAAFAATAAYCAEKIQATDLFGTSVLISRFQCNLVLKSRRAASDVIRGIRNAARLFLRYGQNGLLQLSVENSIALQQPDPLPNGNAQYTLNGGWPAYEFGDGTNGTTGIARTSTGASSVRRSANSTANTPNRFVSEFQDAFNDYQQDSFSIVNADDVAATGQEITSTIPVLGVANFDQAARILQFYLSKSIEGNTIVQFQTSVKALGLAPGDIIAITYLKEGFQRQPFRITQIQAGPNYLTATLTAQLHDDQWYYDTNGQTLADSSRRQGAFGVGLPRPLAGTLADGNGNLQFVVSENVNQAPDGTATVTAAVSFSAPASTQVGAPDIPLISLVAAVTTTGGTLAGNQDLYYAISSVNADGTESALSFIVMAQIPQGNSTNSVTLTGITFPPAASGFQVYRGENPSNLFLISKSHSLATTFLDSGLSSMPVLPPDPNYDHADFYWRLELLSAVNATTFSSISIGSSILEMVKNSYVGMVVRIVEGTGSGQERVVSANSATLLNLSQSWDILPDSSSQFVVAQGTYQFGATTRTSPAQFTIPNQAGNIIQISGRSANSSGIECPYEISPLTRYKIGGAGIVNVDSDVPALPGFGVGPGNAGGTLQFGAVGFSDLSNVSTVTAGTYAIYCLDETDLVPMGTLSQSISATDNTIVISPQPEGMSLPVFLLIDSEIMSVTKADSTGAELTVLRGLQTSSAAAHNEGTSLFLLTKKIFVVPFPKNFFGTPASGDWSYPVSLPNVRVISAELTVTNSQGDSPTSAQCYASDQDGGLRTLSGGQFTFQVSGFLAVQTGAAPNLVVDSAKVVRDVYAVVKQPPSGSSISVNIKKSGNLYCSLSIPAGSLTMTAPLDGVTLPAMSAQEQLSIDIVGVGETTPGSDLTVVIRT